MSHPALLAYCLVRVPAPQLQAFQLSTISCSSYRHSHPCASHAVLCPPPPLAVPQGELDRVRGGYYPGLFFPELAKVTNEFVPLLEGAYYIRNIKGSRPGEGGGGGTGAEVVIGGEVQSVSGWAVTSWWYDVENECTSKHTCCSSMRTQSTASSCT